MGRLKSSGKSKIFSYYPQKIRNNQGFRWVYAATQEKSFVKRQENMLGESSDKKSNGTQMNADKHGCGISDNIRTQGKAYLSSEGCKAGHIHCYFISVLSVKSAQSA
jgi:hypothetical protein